MKVCKKCKKQVANKAKLCKYCGSDVSKCKVIKNNNSSSYKSKKDNVKLSDINNKNDKLNETKDVSKKKVKENKNIIINKPKDLTKNNIDLNVKKDDVKNEKSLKKDVRAKCNRRFDVYKLCNIFKCKRCFLKFNFHGLIEDAFLNRFITVFSAFLIGLSVILFITYFVIGIFGLSFSRVFEDEIIAKKATNDKVFSMDDVISYNGVNYKIISVEASNGNRYKSPKDGNQFLIVTVSITNNTDKKVNYSYENWTMTNSLNEEKEHIFTSINVGNALYAGELVIGGVKTGSIVFEQPINDKKLRINFYELTHDKYGNDVVDKSKKVFSVSAKISPKEEEKKTKTLKETKKDAKKNVKGDDKKSVKKELNS